MFSRLGEFVSSQNQLPVNNRSFLTIPTAIPTKARVPRWRDGRAFDNRVQVESATGRYLYRVPGDAAYRMCLAGSCEPVFEEKKSSKIWKIVVLRIPDPTMRTGDPEPKHPGDYGQRYVFKERLGPREEYSGNKTYKLRRIPKKDRWAYTECSLADFVKPD